MCSDEFFVSLRPSTPRFLPQTTHLRERCAPICFFMIGGLWVGARRVCCGVRAGMGAGMPVAVIMEGGSRWIEHVDCEGGWTVWCGAVVLAWKTERRTISGNAQGVRHLTSSQAVVFNPIQCILLWAVDIWLSPVSERGRERERERRMGDMCGAASDATIYASERSVALVRACVSVYPPSLSGNVPM